MRFDDMLATVFSQSTNDSAALAAAWMQTVDILAQDRGSISPKQRTEAFTRLTKLRPQIPVDRRKMIADMLSSRPLAADVVSFFGADAPVVAASILTRAQLSVEQWQFLLPRLPQPSRALVRERRDLSPAVLSMLQSFGAADVALPAGQADALATINETREDALSTAEEPAKVAAPGPSQISDLVARIEAYRRDRDREREQAVVEPIAAKQAAPSAFRFETEADGVILWVGEAPGAAIIGINIGLMAEVGAHGVDGHAAGAFRKRTPFRDARMSAPGQGELSGIWLISGTPWFNSSDGRFCGYRCTARRPLREENLAAPSTNPLGSGLPPDSVRQLVHELRTPLNAIRGFAEMITGQLLGPVAAPYRNRASAIIDDSRRLIALFDDLDAAARLDQIEATPMPNMAPCEARRLLHGVAANLSAFTDAREVHLAIRTDHTEALVAADTLSVERIYTRLLSTVIGLARSGELISARLENLGDMITLSVDLPESLKGSDEERLLDPAFWPRGDWPDAPALGVGFALRLISNMARAANGQFLISANAFVLTLPAMIASANAEQK